MTNRFASLELPVDVPAKMVIQHPLSGQPLRTKDGAEAYVELLSSDSRKVVDFDRKQTTTRLARRARVALTADDLEGDTVERLAIQTTGWLLAGLDGEPIDVTYSEAAARELYAAPAMAWLREQVVAFQANRANFSKAS